MSKSHTSEPTSLGDVAAYAEASKKLDAISAQLDQINQRIESRKVALRELARVDDKDARAVLDGVASAREIVRAGEDKELKTLLHQRSILQRAVEMQREEFERVKGDANLAVCNTFRPLQAAVTDRLAHCVIELGKAIEEETALRVRLAREGLSTSTLKPLPFPYLGSPKNYHSIISMWLKSAIVNGLLSADNLPQEWRKVWGC